MAAASKKNRLPVYIVISLLVVFSVAFVVILAITTENEMAAEPIDANELTADTYMTEVSALLENADAANGAVLVEKYGCIACHRGEMVAKIAPPFIGAAERATTRRPPLTAAAYIYEAIVNPTAYVVPDFNAVMPTDYAAQFSESDLGDIMAYLLTPDAH